MPMNHKKKWFINDDVGSSLSKYVEIISWLRVMGCFDGSVFEDIPNLNWSGEGYPLLEVESATKVYGRSENVNSALTDDVYFVWWEERLEE
ncbi:hypothetical protein LIER_38718 [Lithospermum erythrorhizon]|uniref:Uncharacterized protein n=1 Tax=Lithospermum erythrorhizon TaxID=34254 RepID=A0AAV3Q472_LITER